MATKKAAAKRAKPIKRQRLLTARQKVAVLESIGKGATITAAAKAAGIHLITVYKWRRADKAFEVELLDRLSMRVQTVEDALYTNCMKGNATSQIFYLCNRSPERWQNVSKIESHVTGEMTHEVKTDLASLLQVVREHGKGCGFKRLASRCRAWVGGTDAGGAGGDSRKDQG